MRWIVALVALVALVGLAGCLRLDAPDGALKCSNNPKRLCPAGFYCLAGDNTCWRDGDFPNDMAEPSQFVPGGDDLSMSMPMDDLATELDLGVPADLLPNDDLLDTD